MGFSDMLFIFFLALIIFGPKRLPEIGRQVGKLMAEFKRHSNEFKSQLENEIQLMDRQERLKKFEAEHPKILPPEASIPKTAATYRPPSFASTVEEEVKAVEEGAKAEEAEAKPVESPAPTPTSDQPGTQSVLESPPSNPNV